MPVFMDFIYPIGIFITAEFAKIQRGIFQLKIIIVLQFKMCLRWCGDSVNDFLSPKTRKRTSATGGASGIITQRIGVKTKPVPTPRTLLHQQHENTRLYGMHCFANHRQTICANNWCGGISLQKHGKTRPPRLVLSHGSRFLSPRIP